MFDVAKTSARASIGDDKGPLIEVTLPLLQTIEPSRLAFDHVDAIKTSDAGGEKKLELMVTAPDFRIESAAICKNAGIEYPAERPDSTWQILNNRNVVSAQLVSGIRTVAAAHPPDRLRESHGECVATIFCNYLSVVATVPVRLPRGA